LPGTEGLAKVGHLDERNGMKLLDGRYVCTHCGTVLKFPVTSPDPHVTVRVQSGSPSVRVLSLDGRELHRCELADLELRTPQSA
jgi:hypothetical protein